MQKNSDTPAVIVITGPTASGKTRLAIDLARTLGTEIINADSRQIYRGIPIITAAPTPAQLAEVPHHLVGTLPLEAYYSAAAFERQALDILKNLLPRTGTAVVSGGSMMYICALVNGIDDIPTISAEVRARVAAIAALPDGRSQLAALLQQLDPQFMSTTPDVLNTKRLAHAAEVCLQTGRPYSAYLTGQRKRRPFRTLTFALWPERADLYAAINARTRRMLADGMEDEARRCYPLRHLNSLNTVGFKEWFTYFDYLGGRLPKKSLPSSTDALTNPAAVADRIAKNTRVYAKKQLTWLARDTNVIRLAPGADNLRTILSHLH